MAVQVLSPQNCLKNPFTSRQASLSPLLKYSPKPNPNPSPDNEPTPNPCSNNKPRRPNPNQSNRQKKRRSSPSNKTNSPPARTTVQKLTAANNQLSGEVKILKRGEKLTKPGAPHQPSTTPKEKRRSPKKDQEHRFYAGSCTSVLSPPPSSLPTPSFLAIKKRVVSNTDDVQELIA